MRTSLNIVTTILAVLANSPVVVLASPAGVVVRTADQVRDRDLTVVDLTWNGPVTPGAPTNTTLIGNAKSIYKQLIVLNPNYLADFSLQDPTTAAAPSARLARRGENGAHLNALQAREAGNLDCNGGSVVFVSDCQEGINYLRALGTASCGTPAHGCSRVSCSNNCGIFLCSTIPGTWAGYCKDIANDVTIMENNCTGQTAFGLAFRGRLTFHDHYTEVDNQSC